MNRLYGVQILIVILSVIAMLVNCLTLASIGYIRLRLSANQTMMLSLCCADLLSAIGILSEVITHKTFPINSPLVPQDQKHDAYCVYNIVKVRYQAV